MGSTEFVSPISLSDGDDVELGHSDGSLDGSLDFLVAFPSETDVVLLITDNSIGFEAGSLTGLGLFLDGFDLDNLFLKAACQELVNNFLFLDGDGESEDVDDVVDESMLDQSAEFGDGSPLNLFFLSLWAFSTFLVASTAESSLLSFRFWCLNFGCLLSHNFK